MIQHLSNNPGRPMSLEEYKEYEKEYEKTLIKSYEAFQAAGHEWCWCLVGNIKEQREYGEEHEIKKGTKAFSGGSKVHIAPVQWGDGGENQDYLPRRWYDLCEYSCLAQGIEV